MKNRFLWLAFVAFLFAAPSWAKPVTLFDGKLTAEVPPLLQPATSDVIDKMFTRAATKPQFVFITVDSETRVSFTLAQAPLTTKELPATMDVLKTKLEAEMPIEWEKSEMTTLDGHPWFHLDYEIQSESEPKHDTILGTSLDGQLLFIAISSPISGYDLIRDDLTTLVQSLRVHKTSKN